MEKKVRYCKLSIALLCFFASKSFALDIITPSENEAFMDIQQSHDVDSQLISANDKLSLHNKNQYEHKSLALTIDSDKNNYEKLITALPENVLSGEGVETYFKSIENIIVNIDKLENKYINDGIALKEESKIIAADYEKLNELSAEKNMQLSMLKKKVVARLIKDLSKPSSVQKFDINGETLCSKFQSIADCLSENEKVIISKTKKTEPFLNDRSVLLSYKVHGASMNMNGMLDYNVSMSFKPSYNNKIEALLNEKFGLRSAVVTLESNVEAEWYVDGNKIGEGKRIQHEVTLGRHGILASYKAHRQSTVEVIDGNGLFSYTFENKKASPAKKESPKVAKKTVKLKKTIKLMKPKSNNLNTNVNSKPVTAEKKTTSKEWKDYLYFMGIEPESAKQKKAFSE
jgi:hypothetical protein